MKSTQAVVGGAQKWNSAAFGKATLERNGELRYRYPAREDISEVSYRVPRAEREATCAGNTPEPKPNEAV
ncbi:MAG: hypothetical protein ABI647_23535 [Gemmatimonadota bacterium]